MTKELTIQKITEFELIRANMIPKFPQRGISQSHKRCIQWAMDMNAKEVCILEDDIWFTSKDSFQRFLDLYKKVPEEADLFFAGCYDGKFTPVPELEGIAKGSNRLSGLHCYIVREKFYYKFLSAEENYNLDFWLTDSKFGNAISYCAYPFVALQHDGYSDNIKQVTQHNSQIDKRYPIWKSPS